MKVSWDPCRLSACRTSSIGPLEWSNTQVTPRLPYHHETHSLTVLSLNVISRNHAFLPKRGGVVYVESRGRHGLIVVAFGVKRPWVDQCNHSANTDSQNHGARHAHCLRVSPRIYSALSKILETRKLIRQGFGEGLSLVKTYTCISTGGATSHVTRHVYMSPRPVVGFGTHIQAAD